MSPCIKSSRWRRRGSSEIELVAGIGIFILLALLSVGMLRLGQARLTTQTEGQSLLNRNAQGRDVLNRYSSNEDLTTATPTDLKSLPNLLLTASSTRNVTINTGSGLLPTTTLTTQAMMVVPVWSLSGYPQNADGLAVRSWFEKLCQPPREGLESPLGLDPIGP